MDVRKRVPPDYGFGEAETEGAALDAGEVTGAGVVGATELETEGAGLRPAEAAADGEPPGLPAGVAEPAGAGETETPGTGVADATGTGVAPWVNSRLRLLGVFAFRA